MIVDINRVRTVYGWLINIANNPNCMTFPVALPDIQSIKNGLIKISHDIEKESPYFSQELFEMKDRMFVGYGTINPVVFGQAIERDREYGISFIQRLLWCPKIYLKMVTMQMPLRMRLLRSMTG